MISNKLTSLLNEWHPKLKGISEIDSTKVVGSRWNRKQLIGHLIDSAANNHHRFIRLQQGNLIGFPGYEQDHWVDHGGYLSNSWSNIVDLWYLYNVQIVHLINDIKPESLSYKWVDKNLDLYFLVEDYVIHMDHHLQTIV